MLKIKHAIAKAVAEHTGIDADTVIGYFKQPDTPERGDLSLPCFPFAKQLRKPPQKIAQELIEPVGQIDEIASAEAVGPYLNIRIDAPKLAKRILPQILDGEESSFVPPQIWKDKSVVIDFSSPNIAKPIAFHHIRSTVIGNALAKIYKALGANVARINYLGDWGTTQGKLIVAFRKWGSKEKLSQDGIKHLLEIYVQFNKEAKLDPSLEEEAREWFKRCEDGDEEALALWSKFREISIKEFERIYKLLGVEFDYIEGESLYHSKAEEIFELATNKAGATESEGAFVIPLDEEGLPPLLLRKKDGATLYATRDIAAAMDRFERFKFDLSLYVVGSQQALYFKQLKLALTKMGFEWAEKILHVPFGMLSIKDPDTGEVSTGSTREGKVVFLEDVLLRAMKHVRKNVEENALKRNLNLSDEEIDKIARQVGVGAVIFADLGNRRTNDVVFDWDRMLSVNGDTAVHIQYTHARCMSMLREAGDIDLLQFDVEHYERPQEHRLIVQLSKFHEAITKAASEQEPSILARYLIELSNSFVSVYELFKTEKYRFLHEDKEIRTSRMALAIATANVARWGLALLGIEAPERM